MQDSVKGRTALNEAALRRHRRGERAPVKLGALCPRSGREVIMAKIKHIAIRTPNPEKTAAFYKAVFGLEEVGRARAGYYLSDGYINLAILQSNDQGTGESPRDVPGYAGIDHLGFLVDDVDETCKKLEEAGAKATMGRVDLGHAAGSDARSYYEIKYRGPDNQVIDITASGWIGT
jgi:catechol 2,3-dioxygenase-like lactoylglutathione lyase family enzyme